MLEFQQRRIQFIGFVVGVALLSITAEKCRQLIGEEASSQSGKFTILNCFDMNSGTVACGVKEGIKLYFYNIRSAHVEVARSKAIEAALVDASAQGLAPNLAAKYAQKEGEKAAKIVTRKAKRIVGPIISSGWDFFEAVYYGGTIAEGSLRGAGTLVGAYAGGFLGEERLGRVGYLVGSHLGSWVGGRIGLMVYDVVNGVHVLLQFSPYSKSSKDSVPYESPASKSSEDSVPYKSPASESSEDPVPYESPASGSSEDSVPYESPAPESPEDSVPYESPAPESSEDSVPYESPAPESSEDSVLYESPAAEVVENSIPYESPASEGSEDSVSHQSPTLETSEDYVLTETPTSENSEDSEGAYPW